MLRFANLGIIRLEMARSVAIFVPLDIRVRKRVQSIQKYARWALFEKIPSYNVFVSIARRERGLI
jgi:hypothetical protein